MRINSSSSCLALCLLLGAGTCLADDASTGMSELTRKVERLEKQNTAIKISYTEARQEAEHAKAQLAEIRTRLEALGAATLGSGEERLIQAVAEIESLNKRLTSIEQASATLSSAVIAYLKQALSEDPESRAQVESTLRRLDASLGYRQEPATATTGTMSEARILSIDADSGVLVLNTGKTVGMRVGMPILVRRGVATIAEAIVTDVRSNICGALVQKTLDSKEGVRVGDIASVKSQD